MNPDSPRHSHPAPPRVLATDLDGTLIPLPGLDANRRDLATLREQLTVTGTTLVFVTGRHLASIREALQDHALPVPRWIVGDVGTTIYEATPHDDWQPIPAYAEHLSAIVAELPVDELRRGLSLGEGLRPQEDEKQGRFKLSYYTDADRLAERLAWVEDWLDGQNAPYSAIGSVDPFTGDGLLDLLPRDVSKAHALRWWANHAGFAETEIVFAGDSGNDLAAFESGYRTIVVGNADPALARVVAEHHRRSGWSDRLYLPCERATSGVLAGCRWFELIPLPTAGGLSEAPVDAPLGATPVTVSRTAFRVWAPERRTVEVRIENAAGDDDVAGDDEEFRDVPLDATGDGNFAGIVTGVGPGARYRYRLDGDVVRPDPRSRFQPEGPHGPSLVVDPVAHPWHDADWPGVSRADLVVYEVHIGTWTAEGTFRAAIERLDGLRDLGITAVEVMPVAQTTGRWNWGYDGVNLFAPRNTYGTPDDFRDFVDACHHRGLGVILDVVYNHVGPEGNYLAEFGPYRSERHHTPWGDALNFDERRADPVRRFVVENALAWLREYHLDGLRLDAVHFMLDDSDWTILDEVRRATSEFAATVGRPIHLIAETNVFDEVLAAPRDVGDRRREAFDLLWSDDFAHSVYSLVAPATRLTQREYHGSPDLLEQLRSGFLFEGPAMQRVTPQQRLRLSADGPRHESLFVGLQTHDLVGNEPNGRRLHDLTSPAVQRAAAALSLLAPWTPLIFMGEETASESPFHFFTDFEDERLRRAVERGRLSEHPGHSDESYVLPTDPLAVERSRLGPASDPDMQNWYRKLLAIRRDWRNRGWLTAANLDVTYDRGLFVIRYVGEGTTHAFVASRPGPEGPAAIRVQVDGELEAVGDGVVVQSPTLEIPPAGVVIGRGDLRVEPSEARPRS